MPKPSLPARLLCLGAGIIFAGAGSSAQAHKQTAAALITFGGTLTSPNHCSLVIPDSKISFDTRQVSTLSATTRTALMPHKTLSVQVQCRNATAMALRFETAGKRPSGDQLRSLSLGEAPNAETIAYAEILINKDTVIDGKSGGLVLSGDLKDPFELGGAQPISQATLIHGFKDAAEAARRGVTFVDKAGTVANGTDYAATLEIDAYATPANAWAGSISGESTALSGSLAVVATYL